MSDQVPTGSDSSFSRPVKTSFPCDPSESIDSSGSDAALVTLAGGLEQSKNFADAPLILQARMRGEWK
jgi:hypothetical protein